MIRKILLKNFRRYRDATIQLQDGLNIIVGGNDAGKSTLLEAINLALTARIGRYHVSAALTSHYLNQDAVNEFVAAVRSGQPVAPPEAFVEVYLDDRDDFASLRGNNNSLREDARGLRLWIRFDEDFADEYAALLSSGAEKIDDVPVEYYHADWKSFSGNQVSPRGVPIACALIDASKIRLSSGSDYYLQQIIREGLSDLQRARLAQAYRDLKRTFTENSEIRDINSILAERQEEITDRQLSMSLDVSARASWESSLVPHLDELPVHFAGGGEQSSLKILLGLTRTTDSSDIVLIEEPENHLAYPMLNRLISKIDLMCGDKQVLVTTHSSFVLNKLGLSRLLLLTRPSSMRLSDLPPETQSYFKRLPGYDTLRMVLANKVILVEGPSDDLVLSRAFRDRHGASPLEMGVDVICVRGLSFKRFLDIAVGLEIPTIVVIDNDGAPDSIAEKYAEYLDKDFIKICYSMDPNLPTLEPQIVACNDLHVLNLVLGTEHETKEELLLDIRRKGRKTEVAIKIFEAEADIQMPQYIVEAVGVR